MQLKLNKFFNFNKEKYDKYLELLPNFKKEKTQKFTTVILTLIAIIILALFAINPTLSTIANLQKQLDDAKFVTGKLDEKINDLSILQTKYNNLEQELPIIYEAIPQKSEVPKFTGQIQKVAKDSSLNISSFQASDLNTVGTFSYYSFNLTAKGEYSNIISFISKLLDMRRVVYISNINMGKSAETNSSIQFSMQGIAFYKP